MLKHAFRHFKVFSPSLSDSLVLSIAGILAIPISLITIPYILDEVGLNIFGELILANTILTLSGLLLLGADRNVTKMLADRSRTYRISSVITSSLLFPIIFSFILFIALGTREHLIILDQTLSVSYIKLLILGAVIQWIWLIQRAIFLANEQYVSVAFGVSLINGALFLAPTLLTLIFDRKFSTSEFLISILLFRVLVITIAGAVQISKRKKTSPISHNLSFSDIFKYGKWLGIVQICQAIIDNVDKVLISIVMGANAVAIYVIPTSVSQKITVIPVSFSIAIFSKKSGNKKRNFEKDLKLIAFFLALCSTFFFPLRDFFFTAWIGSHYTQLMSDLSIYSFIAYSIFGINSTMTSLIEAENNAKILAKFDIATLLVTIAAYAAALNDHGIIAISILFLINQSLGFLFRLKNLKTTASTKTILLGSVAFTFLLGALNI